MAPPALRLAGVTKRFGALTANDRISLELARGEVLGLLGENGAGKSTLVSVLFGHYVADEGTVEVFGAPLPPGQPKAALAAGVGMVHQHFTLADNLSVLDNVLIGTEKLWQPFSRRRAARDKLLDTAKRFGLAVDPDARIVELSVGERQRVEILKALYRGARILILDEPTAVLTPQEATNLFATLKTLVADGLSIVFISHKLDEVMAVCDRVAVLRQGKLISTLNTKSTTKAELAELMVGRRVEAPVKLPFVSSIEKLLEVKGLSAGRLSHAEFEVRGGEIFGIAGVSGNGQAQLAAALSGMLAPAGGEIRVAGAPVAASPRAFVGSGVARVPEDRGSLGVIGDLAVWENAVSERYREARFSRAGWLRRGAASEHAGRIVKDYDVRCQGLFSPARAMSGGNIQKLVLGRALVAEPRVIVANQPTWGLDVGAVSYIHEQLLAARSRGAAVVLISDDLDELFALADRIAVMFRGRLSPARSDWTLGAIGLAMAERRGGLMRFEARSSVPPALAVAAPFAAIAFTLIACAGLIVWAGAPVGRAYALLFEGAFGSRFAITETLTRATPLIFTGLAAAVAFRARFFNIGGEGQLYVGALAAVAVAGAPLGLPAPLQFVLMIVAGMLAGAVLLLIPALAKTRLGVDEVVTTLLFNFVALLFVSMMLDGPMKDPTAMGWPQSIAIPDELAFGKLLERSRVHTGLLMAVVLAAALWVVDARTSLGYEMRAVGANANAARFAGISVNAVMVKTALLSGALAGLAGVSEVAGRAGYLTLDMSPGYGYSGIVIAMLAGLNPLGVVAAALFVAGVLVGADSMSRAIGVPTYLADVIVSVSLLAMLVAAMLARYRVRWS